MDGMHGEMKHNMPQKGMQSEIKHSGSRHMMHTEMFKRRFFACLALTIPVLVFSEAI